MYKKEIFIVVLFLCVAVGILFSSTNTKTINSSPQTIGSLSSVEEGVYTIEAESGVVDYLKIIENNADSKKIKVQFLLKPRLATKVAEPWLEYQELSYFLNNEKASLIRNNDTNVSIMFSLKNN